MSEVIAYVAPSPAATIDEQIATARKVVSDEQFIRVDRPKTKHAPLLRAQRDFVFDHLLRTAALNKDTDGKPDTLWVYSLDVLADSRAEVERLFASLVRLDIPLVSEADGLAPEVGGMEYTLRFAEALKRAEGRWARSAVRVKGLRKGGRTRQDSPGRPRKLGRSELAQLVQWVEEERLAWSAMVTRFKERGISISVDTLKRYYKELQDEAARVLAETGA
jgi:DNA invertase Pin-like site-specific DNA recombinase